MLASVSGGWSGLPGVFKKRITSQFLFRAERRAAELALARLLADGRAPDLRRRVGSFERSVGVVAHRPCDRDVAEGRKRDAPDVGTSVACEPVDDATGLLVLVARPHQIARAA